MAGVSKLLGCCLEFYKRSIQLKIEQKNREVTSLFFKENVTIKEPQNCDISFVNIKRGIISHLNTNMKGRNYSKTGGKNGIPSFRTSSVFIYKKSLDISGRKDSLFRNKKHR